MKRSNLNNELSVELLKRLLRAGLDTFVVCGGSRNTPIIAALSKCNNVEIFNHFEERSASFFAIGISKRISRPVAVVVTSGTAAAELLPSCIEAYYQNIPLVLITADRPKSYRGTGAPQSIDQSAIFGTYAQSFDIESLEEIECISISPSVPTHINVCFDEPILSEEINLSITEESLPISAKSSPINDVDTNLIANFIHSSKNMVLILSELSKDVRTSVKNLCLHLQLPIYAEPLSGLREDSDLKNLLITCGEKSLTSFDSYLRIGGIPVISTWRTLAKTPNKTLSIDDKPFSGLPGGRIISGDIELISQSIIDYIQPSPKALPSEENAKNTARLQDLLNKYPYSEPTLISRLSKMVNSQDFLYLGNSLPVREWDLTAARDVPHTNIYANRGANGIDGQISTFLGAAAENVNNWCIVGDLTTLYDHSGFWALRLRPELKLHICVINNQGGQIFDRLQSKNIFPKDSYNTLIKNSHQYSFQSVAAFWDLPYQLIQDPETINRSYSSLVEIRPDPIQTQAFWHDYDQL